MKDNSFDHEEFKQSYEHYRHLEQERSRHLAFFFTLVGGLLGLVGFLVKDGKLVAGLDWLLFVVGLIIVFLQILDTVVFAAIRRIGDARAQHAAAINHLRGLFATDTYIAELWKSFEKRAHVSVQRAAEITLHLFASLFVAATSIGSICAMNAGAISWSQGIVLLSLTIIFGGVHVAACVYLKPSSKVQPNTKSHAGLLL